MADNIIIKDGNLATVVLRSTDIGGGIQSPHHTIDSLPPLPAGSNNIGSVSISGSVTTTVTSLPALPTGSNNIGSVSISGSVTTTVTSLPALPTGSNTIGAVTISGNVTTPAIRNTVTGTDAPATALTTAATAVHLSVAKARGYLFIHNPAAAGGPQIGIGLYTTTPVLYAAGTITVPPGGVAEWNGAHGSWVPQGDIYAISDTLNAALTIIEA